MEEKIESNTPSQAELIISTDTSTSSTITGFGKPSDDAMTINLSQVSYGISGDILPFYHCGPSLDSVTTELVLLHGSTGTKEHWKETGILDDLCNGIMSASALDFPPGSFCVAGVYLLASAVAFMSADSISIAVVYLFAYA